jgi:carbamoyl-phosphate synthase large subunit
MPRSPQATLHENDAFAAIGGSNSCTVGDGSSKRNPSTETDSPNVVRTTMFYADLGFTLYATSSTGGVISEAGIPVNILPKLASGQRPNVIDLMKNKDMALVINTPGGKNPREDEVKIRTTAMQNRIPIMTTLRGADAALRAIKSLQGSEVQVRALQEYHR